MVGGRVYRLGVDALTGKHLSPYTRDKVFVDLTPEEREAYEREYAVFTGYLKKKGLRMRSPRDFQRFIIRTGRGPEARKALLARNRAVDVALNSRSKIEALADRARDSCTQSFTGLRLCISRSFQLFLGKCALTHKYICDISSYISCLSRFQHTKIHDTRAMQ